MSNTKSKGTKLFQRDFTMVVIGQIISLFGNSILRFALPLYLLKTTNSPSLFGIVTACSFLPMILLSLLGGVLADRVNKRDIMVILDFSTAAIILILSLLLGRLPIVPLFIVVLMLLYGIQGAYQPAVQASIPVLAAEDKLLTANAVINQISALANLLGPVIGGILYSYFGIKLILFISIICFVISATMEIFIKIPHQKRVDDRRAVKIVVGDLKESYQFIKKERPIFFSVVVLIALFNLFVSAMIVIGLPIIMVDTLKMSDDLFGISQGALAFGGLAGGVLTGVLGSKLNVQKSHYILLACTLTILPMGLSILFDLPNMVTYLIISVMSFFCMACSTMFTIQMLTLVQGNTPRELVGKVISCLMAICMCAQPIGQAMYGFLFEALKGNAGIVVLGAAGVGCLISLYSNVIFKKVDLSY